MSTVRFDATGASGSEDAQPTKGFDAGRNRSAVAVEFRIRSAR